MSINGLLKQIPFEITDKPLVYEPQPFPEMEYHNPPAVAVGTRPIVIGVCGFKGHGKDTAGEVLVRKYGFQRVSFADGVKKVVAEILHIPVWWLHDPERKEGLHEPSGKTYRKWMQLMGTEVGRSIWGDAWVYWWKTEIEQKGYERVVCTDLRFWNEFGVISDTEEWDAMTLRIYNRNKPIAEDAHESERYALMFPVNAEIVNNGTKDQLWEKVETKVLHRWPELW